MMLFNVIRTTRDPNNKNYVNYLMQIARELLDIHNAKKVHKDFHSGNILYDGNFSFIIDLGMCKLAIN